MKHKLWFKWILCLLPAFLGVTLYFVLPFFPEFTEYAFSRGLFRIIAFPLEYLMSLIPFSVTEAVVLLLIPTIISIAIVFIIRLIKRGHPLKTAERGVRFVAFCLSLMLFIFMLTDGVNFSRVPLGELMELPDREYTAEELYKVTADLAQKASETCEKLPKDENGCTKFSRPKEEILKLADDCYKNLASEYSFFKTGATRVKGVYLSEYWSYTGITGVYCPWLLEASVNTHAPNSGLPHTSAHEIAHTMGFAKENECNFAAYLACITSEIEDYEYSGYLSAFIYCSNSLFRADRELWRKAYSVCSKQVLRDISERNKYWSGYQGKIMSSSESFNDAFIKANGVESGTMSYNQMVRLVLRHYDSLGFLK